MFCPKCGVENADGSKFCSGCGTSLVSAPAETASPSNKATDPAATSASSPQPAEARDAKKRPIIIGAVAVIVVALVAVFAVGPTLGGNSSPATEMGSGSASKESETKSKKQTKTVEAPYENPFVGAQVGDKVKFGSYEQDGKTSNGKEQIEWRVLAVDGDRALVVSEKGLDAKPINEGDLSDSVDSMDNDWDSSDLKAWLENDFVSQAFSDEEKEDIDGSPTLLTTDEANQYFESDESRVCYPTKQAVKNGAWTEDNDACYWWLSSPSDGGSDTWFATACVDSDGGVFSLGIRVVRPDVAVRPALWVSL